MAEINKTMVQNAIIQQSFIEELRYWRAERVSANLLQSQCPILAMPSIHMGEQTDHPQLGILVRIEGHLNFWFVSEDSTLPPPWKGVFDDNNGILYYWHPQTNVSQYENQSLIRRTPSESIESLIPML